MAILEQHVPDGMKNRMNSRFDVFSAAQDPFASLNEAESFLKEARTRLGVLNLSYWFLGGAGAQPEAMLWLSTYDEAYTALYRREFSPRRDSAFRLCFNRFRPLDWDEARSGDATVESIHAAAERFGIGRHGISVPIRDGDTGDAMFSVNLHCGERDWLAIRSDVVGLAHLFAHYFHGRMRPVVAPQAASPDAGLSPREREVLQWAAEGKTAWETARLLGLSESAVNLYATRAMTKLGARTKTQAVAIAVRRAILN